tara:strand:- start:8191 stop:10683 length:2493 start_codon:yes stop_codon:yes gene_type:complete
METGQESYILGDLPRQRVPRSKKGKKWARTCIDELEKITYGDINYNGRSSRVKKQVNYDLFNGKLNQGDFTHILNPFGFSESEFPATMQHYDIISPKIQLLMGEEIKRPFNFKVVSHDPDAISKIEEQKKEMLMQYLYSVLVTPEEEEAQQQQMQELAASDPEKAALTQPKTPAQIEKYINFEYQDIREITAQRILEYLTREDNLEEKFNRGFKDALIAGEEIYWVGDISGNPTVRVCNPLDIRVILDPDSPWIDESQAVIEERWLTLSTVLDEYYEYLEPSELDMLEKGVTGRDNSSKGGVNYPYSEFNIINYANVLDTVGSGVYDPGMIRSYRRNGMVRVLQVEWKSMRKIGIISYSDESGTKQEDIVDEIFELPKYAEKKGKKWLFDGVELQWFWISEYWEGTKIAEDIYCNVKPKLNQRRDLNNPSDVKSGYVGYIYNERNSESISLIDRMKPFQYLYNIIYYRTELALAKSKGKVALMDIAQIPSSEGWDVSKWMYYLESMGVMFINSREEGNRSTQAAPFNQFQSIDLSMGNYINTHVQLLENVKNELGELSGVSRQRQGQVSSSELVGNTERAVVQSSHITEFWFYAHNECKKKVLTALVDVAKMSYREGKKIQYIADDMSRTFMNIEPEDFTNSSYGIFVSNASKDDRALDSLKSLAQSALQAGVVSFTDVASILQSESITTVRKMLENSQAEMEKKQAEAQQAEMQSAQQVQQAETEKEMAKEDREDARTQLDNETKVKIALINAEARLIDADDNNDGYVDRKEGENASTEIEDSAKRALEQQKMQADLGLKKEELAEKKRSNKANESIKRSSANKKKANE